VRHGRAGGDDVGAHAVDLERRADPGDVQQGLVVEPDEGHQRLRLDDPFGDLALVVRVGGREAGRVGVVGQPPAHHVDAQLRVTRSADVHAEPEPVEQLGPQVSLLGVHRPDQHEPRRVAHRHAVALHGRPAHGGSVEQEVDEVVVQQVDLVDVQQAAMRVRQQPGVVLGDAVGQRPAQVQRAHDPVLGRADGQLDEPGRAGGAGGGGVRSVGAAGIRLVRVAGEAAARDHRDVREQRRERADHRRLGGALLAAHEHPAHVRRDRRQDEREREVVGTDDRAEREMLVHV
jgi:hypothetical protein